MCGLDLSTWTIPDREAHADGCVESAPGADAAVGAERTAGVGVPSPSPGCQPRSRREPEPVAGDWTERPSSEAISTFQCRRRLRRTAMGRAGTMG